MIPPTLPLWVGTAGLPQEEAEETFLLLHGYGGSSFTWRNWVPYLATRGHVALVDMKGFGLAEKPRDGRYAPADQAELVLHLIRTRGFRRLTLVGHSVGGAVALLVALAMQEDGAALHRLVMVGGAAYRQRLPPFVTLARFPRLARAAMRILGPRFIVAQVLRSIVFDTGTVTAPQVLGYAAPLGSTASTAALLQAARQVIPDDADAITRRYPTISTPTLLLWGRHDPVVPLWVAERLSAALPRSTLHVLERCGHIPAEEAPAASLAALHGFFTDTG